jgi:PAS domain S-box-containing protein
LGEVFLTLTSRTSREEVLDEILRQAQRIVAHSAANIMLLKNGILRIVRWQGYEPFGSEKLLDNLEQSLLDFPLDAQVVQSRQPLLVADTYQNPHWVTVPESSWIRSFVAVPICLREGILGLLRLDSNAIGTFSQQDVKRLLPLANAAAIALENARLYDETRREVRERKQVEAKIIQRNAQLMALQYAGAAIASSLDLQHVLQTITAELANLLQGESCIIFEWNRAAGIISAIAQYSPDKQWTEGSLIGNHFLTTSSLGKQVLLERHAQQRTASQAEPGSAESDYMQAGNIKTLLWLPMEVQSQVIGMVEVGNRRTERVFTDEEVGLAQLLANQAATTIQNAHLYHKVRLELAERIQVERELRQVALKNQAMLDAIPDTLFYFSREGRLLDYKISQGSKLPTGVQGETNIGRDVREMLPPDLADLALVYINQAHASHTIPVFEYQLDFSPKIQYFEARFVASGPNEVLMIVRNITRRKQTGQALKKSEANLKAIFDNTIQAFLLIDIDGKIQAFNNRANGDAQAIFGRELKEGNSIYELMVGEDLESFRQKFTEALRGASVNFERCIKVGDRTSWYEVNFNPVFVENSQVIGVCFNTINIDERKKAVEALAASEARLLTEMQSVLVITEALVSEINLNNLLEFIITQAEHLLNANGAAVLFLSEDGQYLEVATPGESWLQIRPGSRLLVDGSLAEQAIITRQTQASNHVLGDSRAASMLALLESAHVSSLLCAPLLVQSRNLGVLLIWSEHEHIFDIQDSRLASLFANQAALALHNAHLHARNRQLAVEEERHRLARELHDSVTQSLYSIGLSARASLRLLAQNDKRRIEEPIKHIHTLSQTALTEMREHLYQLHPTVLNEDLVEALTQHCNMLSKQYALNVEFKADLETALTLSHRDTLYFIVREALWNTVKHAKATTVNVTLTKDNNEVVVAVEDNGVGFEPSTRGSGTMGLRIMKERARLLGGVFEVQSVPGQGTHLMVRIPLEILY